MTKKLYVNQKKADVVTNDILKQLSVLEKQFDKMSEVINKCIYKKMISGEKRVGAISLSKKCANLSKKIRLEYAALETKYNKDKSDYTINILNEKIKSLEEKFDLLLK